jgi:hypothetical protein
VSPLILGRYDEGLDSEVGRALMGAISQSVSVPTTTAMKSLHIVR